jgi:hypothetical protein
MQNGYGLGRQAPEIYVADYTCINKYSICLTHEAAEAAWLFAFKMIHAGGVSHFQYRGNRG